MDFDLVIIFLSTANEDYLGATNLQILDGKNRTFHRMLPTSRIFCSAEGLFPIPRLISLRTRQQKFQVLRLSIYHYSIPILLF